MDNEKEKITIEFQKNSGIIYNTTGKERKSKIREENC